jgi:hypothetical protein
MSKVIEYPKDMIPLTSEEKAESKRIIAEAKANGHPLAQFAGTLPDDEVTRDWIRAMREYRQQIEDDPEAW